MNGFEKDRENLEKDWKNIEGDFARALELFAKQVARDVMDDGEGVIYVKVSPTRRATDEDSKARSPSYITPKRQQGIKSKLASILSIISAIFKRIAAALRLR